MMKMNLYLILFLTSLSFGACKKSNPIPSGPTVIEQDPIFELLWATRMDFEKEIVNLASGESYGEWFLYPGDLGDPPTVMAFNKDTGDKDWEYVHDGVIEREFRLGYVFDNIYVGMSGKGIVGIDLDLKTSIWEIDLNSMGMTSAHNFEEYDNHLYFHPFWGLGSTDQKVKLFKLTPATGELEVVYQNIFGAISPPVFHVDIESNVNIVFNEHPWENEIPQESVQNLVRLNLETSQEMWRADSISHFFATNLGQNPVIYDNRIVITGGDWTIYAFDLNTGEKLWQYEFDYPWSIWNNTNHLIHDDRLYVNNGQKDVTCLNPETGELIWNNPEGGPNCTEHMLYYEKEDLLVFTSWGFGSVMVLDALTGVTLHREHRYDNSSYSNDVVYDEERDLFFTCTYKHAVGFKISRSK